MMKATLRVKRDSVATVLLLLLLLGCVIQCSESASFFHISDIHLDLFSQPQIYGPPTWCQTGSNNPFEGQNYPGPYTFGRLGCDTYYPLLTSTYEKNLKF